jgi:opacity protein-like surface antigen
MLKRSLMLCLFFVLSLPTAFAASFYIAPTVMYQGISSKNIDFMGLTPRLSVGYGGNLYDSPVYLAGEIFGSPRGATLHNHRGTTVGLKPKYSLGVSFIPGICLDSVLLAYLRLGIIDTKFDNLDASRMGAQGGVGLQYNMTASWDIRADYTYTGYRSVKPYIGSPKSDEYALGLVYRFG